MDIPDLETFKDDEDFLNTEAAAASGDPADLAIDDEVVSSGDDGDGDIIFSTERPLRTEFPEDGGESPGREHTVTRVIQGSFCKHVAYR